ncbi:TonB-dependent receptor [uncultured Bacteroides sp.]|uniref:SusC/RagA family TonB-linked outer membrane protein n=1 Tax=uncultured Bacteroides sp. TaxID=162156 RepID=UPI0026756E49|nr:TonB-dependent receptor [uncultured Bacteroides sp.]
MKNAVISKAKWYIRCCSLVYLSISFSSVVHSAEDVSKMNSVAIAQQAKTRTVVGSVIDFETGEPIIGASVAVIGKSIGTISDLDGNFSVRVDGDNVKLEVSFIGYKKQTVTVGENAKKLTVRLQAVSELLDEVVVVGYGSTKRKDLTGAISKPNIQDMQKAPVSNFEETLAGRVAGVQVVSSDGQPGSDLQIVIRGNNSVTQDNSPLYVVDGFPLESSVGNTLNPEEIESMEVLKDASATAIYGARGANGVILITTKKGKISAPVVTYNGWVGVQQIIKTQDVLSPYEFVRYQLEQDYNVYSKVYLNDERTLDYYKDVKGVDWQDLVFRDALVHNHNIAVRGGNEKTRYAISGSLMDQKGIVLNSGYKKYQGRIVLDQIVNKKLKVGINANYTYTKKYGTVVAESQSSPTASLMYSVWGYRPVSGVDGDDLLNDLFDTTTDPSRDYRINPLMAVENEYNPLHTYNFIGNAYFEYKILDNLTLRVTGGYNKINQRREVFYNSKSRGGHPYTNNKVNGWITNIERTNFLNENTLTYNVKLKKGHALKLLGGFTIQDANMFSSEIKAINVPNESLGIAGLDEGEITSAPIVDSSNGLVSYLGRVDYNYKSRYLLTASFRADGSSKFAKENRWAYFPSASVAWGFGEEKFMKNFKWLSNGKLRVGIGSTGNNRVTDYAALTSLMITPDSGYSTGNIPGKGVVPKTLGNPTLKWETTVQTNVGLDLSFLNSRISLTADYYYKETKDLLLNATLAPSMGFLSAYKNVGRVSNSGIELTLDTRNMQTKNFSWTSSFNISFNRNKVLALNDDEPSLATRVTWGNFNNAYPYIAIPGHPIAMFYGYIFDGVYQYTDFDEAGGKYTLKAGVPNNGNARESIQPGDIKFRDINHDGIVDNYDLTIIGNPNPKHIGGFNNNFQYKNFDMNIFFQWSYGGDVLNANRIEFEGGEPTARTSLNMFASFADRWTPENQTNSLYRVGGQGPAVYSSRTIEDGSFLRLKTIALGYRLPSSWLKKINVKSLRVYASAQNLITWTKYSGLDPEVSTRPSALTPSFDWSPYPRPRTLTLGVDISF